MARLAQEPYPIAEGKDHETIALLRQRSNSLPHGEVVGALLKYQRADGYAYYLVVKDRPLTLQHVPVFDGYGVEPELIRGLTLLDVLNRLDGEWRLAALLEQRRVNKP